MSVFSPIHLRRIAFTGRALGSLLIVLAVTTLGFVLSAPALAASDGVREAAEWAREKDVVTLSLTVSLALIAFCGWLVRQMFKAQEASSALWAASIQKIDALRAELANRPCVLPTRVILPPLP